MLTPRKREFLYDEIISIADEVRSYSISSEEIDQAIKSNVSLNQLFLLIYH